MADIQAHLSARFDLLQKSVDRASKIAEEASVYQMEQSRATKAIRLPIVQATGANPFTMGGDAGVSAQGSGGNPIVGPEQGFVWSLRHLVIEGMTRTATPDIIQIRRSSATGQVIWELNGNQYAQTWGRGEIVIYGGETLFYTSVGTFASVATIKAYGMAEQVPGEKIAIFF